MVETQQDRAKRRLQIIASAERCLRDSSYALRAVRCNYDDGTLLLEGRVSCFYHKQVAQTLVQQVDRVERIVNLLEVPETEPVTPFGDV